MRRHPRAEVTPRAEVPGKKRGFSLLLVVALVYAVPLVFHEYSRSNVVVKRGRSPQRRREKFMSTKPAAAPRLAFAVTVTRDTDPPGLFVDGAAVLARSIRLAQARSRWGPAALVAFVSPMVGAESRRSLTNLGYEVSERPLPIEPSKMQGNVLRDLWSADPARGGCCGAWELLKLYTWTLTQFERVVHVDMDCLLLNPIDDVLDRPEGLVYTADYNMMNKKQRSLAAVAMQGGFLAVRPSLKVFEELVKTEQRGHFGGKHGPGWEKSGIGHWWGGNTIQGLLPFFFSSLSQTNLTAEEKSSAQVDRCVYDNMVDSAVLDPPPTVGSADCRLVPFESVKFAHFTVCQKPWTCNPQVGGDPNKLCNRLHATWFQLRADIERSMGQTPPEANRYCRNGKRGYKAMDISAITTTNASLASVV